MKTLISAIYTQAMRLAACCVAAWHLTKEYGCRAGLFTLLIPLYRLVGFLFFRELEHYYGLRHKIRKAYSNEDYAKVRELSRELLRLAHSRPRDWNYGNAVYYGNMYLGLIQLKQDCTYKAKKYLRRAGKTPGSPQLDSYGPPLLLARELLARGERESVLQFLGQIGKFYGAKDTQQYTSRVLQESVKSVEKNNRQALSKWKKMARKGKIPDDPLWQAR